MTIQVFYIEPIQRISYIIIVHMYL